jgi:hypothetical protein
MTIGNQNLLFQLVGESLNAVTFIEDYVELSFNGPKLQALTLIRFIGEGLSLNPQQPGWRDGLCSLIGQTVSNVKMGDDFEIRFSSGGTIYISLRAEDHRGPEAMIFLTGKSDIPNVLIV